MRDIVKIAVVLFILWLLTLIVRKKKPATEQKTAGGVFQGIATGEKSPGIFDKI